MVMFIDFPSSCVAVYRRVELSKLGPLENWSGSIMGYHGGNGEYDLDDLAHDLAL